ncbi:MAG: hypothetical protein M3Y91_08195 [Actinomycetota bacterium]|nr:hypothetical protein [Actinomycetota bacterium]
MLHPLAGARRPVTALVRGTGRLVPSPARAVARRLFLVALVAGFVLGFTPIAALAAGAGTADAGGGPAAPSLPLLRWANAVATIHTHYGVGSVISAGDPFLTGIAGLVFQVSALLWQVLGTLVTAAQGTDLIRQTEQLVNPVYHKIGVALLGTSGATSVVVLVIIVAAGMVAYQAYRQGSGVSGALRGLAGVLLPVGLLVVTVSSAAAGSTTVDTPGSPSWAVQKVTGWTTALSGSVAQLSDEFGPVGTPGISGNQNAKVAGCANYVDGLDNLYAAQNGAAGTGPPSLQVADSIVLSQIWESAVMAPWIQAQFGPGPLGDKAFCHLLEIQANVSAQDQVLAMYSDGPNGPYTKSSSGPPWNQLVGADPNIDHTHPPYVPLLGPDYANGDDDLRRNMIAWATCDYTGPGSNADNGWTVDPAFAQVFNAPPSVKEKTCSTWWDQGTTKPPPTGGTFTTNGPFDFEDENAIHTATNANGHDSPDARNYIQGLNGHNSGLALSTSLIALMSSITYAWSLGGLALGVLIGKLSLIILMACAPIFLLLAAIPSETTRRAARKAFGLSFAALLSTFTFSVLMGLLLLFIGLLQDVTLGLFNSDAGTLPGLIEGLIPLAALYLLRKLLRLVGMDSITSLRGAIKTTAAFGQMGAGTGQPVNIRSRLQQASDLRSAADTLKGRAGSGSRPYSFATARPRLPDNRPPVAAGPLPWNRTWRDLLEGRAIGGQQGPSQAGPAPPALPRLNAGPAAAPSLIAGRLRPLAPPLTAGSAGLSALSPMTGPRPRRVESALQPGATVDFGPASRPAPIGRLLLPAGFAPTSAAGADPSPQTTTDPAQPACVDAAPDPELTLALGAGAPESDVTPALAAGATPAAPARATLALPPGRQEAGEPTKEQSSLWIPPSR